jgi:hypothetical protein
MNYWIIVFNSVRESVSAPKILEGDIYGTRVIYASKQALLVSDMY